VIARRLILVACLVMSTGAVLRLSAAADSAPAASLHGVPLAIDAWRGRDDAPLDADTLRVLQADDYLLRTYARDSRPLGLYIAYYATQRSGHTVHSPLNCLPGTGWEWLERGRVPIAVADGSPIVVNRAVAQRDADRMLVYYWYQSRGRVVASEYENKLRLIGDALRLHRSDGALVRLVSPVARGSATSADAESFIAALYPQLTRHLPE